MNRRLASCATVLFAIVGLTACSGAPAATQSPVAATTSAPADQATTPAAQTTASGQTLAEACLEPSAKLAEASAELAKAGAAVSAGDGKNAQDVADALAKFADYFGAFASSTKNTEVAKALSGIESGYRKLSTLYPKAVDDHDLDAMADMTKVMADLQKSLSAFTTLCSA